MVQSLKMIFTLYVNFRLILIVNRIRRERKLHVKDVVKSVCQVHVSNTMIANTDVIDGLDLDREDFDIDDNDDAEDEFSKIEKLILEAAPSPDQ